MPPALIFTDTAGVIGIIVRNYIRPLYTTGLPVPGRTQVDELCHHKVAQEGIVDRFVEERRKYRQAGTPLLITTALLPLDTFWS